MSADITLKTEKINAQRKILADEMANIFGPYTVEADTYIFKPTFAEMAKVLVLDGSLISRLLAPPNLEKLSRNTVSLKSYHTILKIVKALVQQKKMLESQHQSEMITLQQQLQEQTLNIAKTEQPKRSPVWKIGTVALCAIAFIISCFTIGRSDIYPSNISALSTGQYQTDKKKSSYLHLPLETIKNPGFDEDRENSAAANWLHEGLGGPPQPTYVQVFDGKTSAKLPKTGDRIGYQLVRVLKNTDYILHFNYLMRGPGYPSGSLTMSILDSHVHRPADIIPATIASKTIDFEQAYKDKYRKTSLTFNSGRHNKVAIYFNNKDIQCKLDNLELEREGGRDL